MLTRRTELRRLTPLPRGTVRLKRTPIARVGRAAKRKRARRAEVVALAIKRDGNTCQAAPRIAASTIFSDGTVPHPGPCGGRLDPHEIAQRSVYPNGELDLDNVLMVCRSHHRWIDANQRVAWTLGLHKFSWDVSRG